MFETLVIRVVRAFHIEGSKVLMVKRAWFVGLGLDDRKAYVSLDW